MFEKEAEEYVMREDVITENDRVPFDNGYGFQTVSFEDEVKKGFKDGAEFGYNKANEWHFVSKEGHPTKDDIYLTIRKDGLHLGDYCCGGDGDIDCQSWCDYPSEEEIQDESVIAWKEIVLPKEIE